MFAYGTWEIVTSRDKIKASQLGQKIGKIFMVSATILGALILFPSYIGDLYRLDISQVTGKVVESDIFPPPLYFISQSIKFDGWEHQNESYRLGLSGTIARPNHIYRIKYLKRSRQIVTIEEVAPGQE